MKEERIKAARERLQLISESWKDHHIPGSFSAPTFDLLVLLGVITEEGKLTPYGQAIVDRRVYQGFLPLDRVYETAYNDGYTKGKHDGHAEGFEKARLLFIHRESKSRVPEIEAYRRGYRDGHRDGYHDKKENE